MQKQTAKWYFHKFGKSYKAGTYKGLDVSIGKGDGVAAGGILLRSLMPLTLSETSDQKLTFTNRTDKANFLEGPCNCINRILAETMPTTKTGAFEIIDLVACPDFSLDIFDPNSCLHLLCDTPGRQIVLPKRQMVKCPRVGLTLKRYDAEKEKYWMANYRYLTFPSLHAKMKDYIIISSLVQGKSITATSELAAAKILKVEELNKHL